MSISVGEKNERGNKISPNLCSSLHFTQQSHLYNSMKNSMFERLNEKKKSIDAKEKVAEPHYMENSMCLANHDDLSTAAAKSDLIREDNQHIHHLSPSFKAVTDEIKSKQRPSQNTFGSHLVYNSNLQTIHEELIMRVSRKKRTIVRKGTGKPKTVGGSIEKQCGSDLDEEIPLKNDYTPRYESSIDTQSSSSRESQRSPRRIKSFRRSIAPHSNCPASHPESPSVGLIRRSQRNHRNLDSQSRSRSPRFSNSKRHSVIPKTSPLARFKNEWKSSSRSVSSDDLSLGSIDIEYLNTPSLQTENDLEGQHRDEKEREHLSALSRDRSVSLDLTELALSLSSLVAAAIGNEANPLPKSMVNSASKASSEFSTDSVLPSIGDEFSRSHENLSSFTVYLNSKTKDEIQEPTRNLSSSDLSLTSTFSIEEFNDDSIVSGYARSA
jgi:hypothetical protein